jgi:hypothetical protein
MDTITSCMPNRVTKKFPGKKFLGCKIFGISEKYRGYPKYHKSDLRLNCRSSNQGDIIVVTQLIPNLVNAISNKMMEFQENRKFRF